ncbi:hypothetical protein BDV19DRAFT_366096 [Aspergillus venezuelensis]
MPMTWTPEANAKPFLAVLDQIKEQGVKINIAKLGEYMGHECSIRAVDHQFQKLEKQAETPDAASGAAAAGAGDGTASASATASATPTKTPTKRRATGSKTGIPRKRGKKQAAATDDKDTAANGDTDDAGGDNGDGQGGSQAVVGDAAG